MSYHKPRDLTWEPAALAERLCVMGLRATVVDERVHITATVTEDSLWNPLKPDDPDRLQRAELRHRLREISGWRTGDFEITIGYLPNKFIRNLQVDRDLEMPWKPWEEFRDRIDRTMNQQGYVRVTNQLESSIARQYCTDLDAIEELEEEIEHQQTNKEKLVNDQDFEGAVLARDMEFDARDRLDALVKKSAMGI